MKLRLILETTEDLAGAVSKAVGALHQTKYTPQEIVFYCKEINPKYWKWVLKQWYNGIRIPHNPKYPGIKLFQEVGPSDVRELLYSFDKIKNKLPNNNIDHYKNYMDLKEATIDYMINRFEKYPGVEVISKNGSFITVSITDVESLKDLSEGTKWCTRRNYPQCRAEEYLYTYGEMLITFDWNKPILHYTPDLKEINDVHGNKVRDEKLLSLIPITTIAKKLLASENQYEIYKFAIEFYIPIIKNRWYEAEPIILASNNLRQIYNYTNKCSEILGTKIPEFESKITTIYGNYQQQINKITNSTDSQTTTIDQSKLESEQDGGIYLEMATLLTGPSLSFILKISAGYGREWQNDQQTYQLQKAPKYPLNHYASEGWLDPTIDQSKEFSKILGVEANILQQSNPPF